MGGKLNIKSQFSKGTSVTFDMQVTTYPALNVRDTLDENNRRVLPLPLSLGDIVPEADMDLRGSYGDKHYNCATRELVVIE